MAKRSATGSNASALKKLKAGLKSAGVIGVNKPKKSVLKRQQQQQQQHGSSAQPTSRGQQIQAALVRMRKDNGMDSANPFEVKVNRVKHDVLNRKIKGTQGMPAQTRAKSIEVRKQGLLGDLQRRNKVGAFIDKRIGENDATLTPEDKMLLRWTHEKQRSSAGGKGGSYNLDSDNEDLHGLTHLGKSVDDLDNFDDLMPSDDDQDGKSGMLDRNFVSQANFGGFEPTTTTTTASDQADDRHKSKSEIMKELIAKSKMHKAERQKVREENEDLRQELDAELDAINHLLVNSTKRSRDQQEEDEKEQQGDGERDETYDQFVRELKFEKRAKPTDRLKTEEEIVAAEREKLESLEKARQKRMLGLSDSEDENDGKNKRRRGNRRDKPAADDIEDDYHSDQGGESADDDDDDPLAGMPLTYRNGVLVNKTITVKPKSSAKSRQEASESEEDEEDDEEDGSDEEEEDYEEGEDSDDWEDDLDVDTRPAKSTKTKSLEQDDESEGEDSGEEAEEATEPQKPKRTEQEKLGAMRQAKQELPYTFQAPETHDDLLQLIGDRPLSDVLTLVQRLRVLYHPRLGEGNKTRLQTALRVLLEHVTYLDEEEGETDQVVQYCKTLFPELLELAKQFPVALGNYATHMLNKYSRTLNQHLANASSATSDGVAPSLYPTIGQLMHFKFFGKVFSTSDYHHVIATPMTLLMCQWLGFCPMRSQGDVVAGLFLCSLLAEFQAYSKRLIPEAVNFLCNVVLAIHPSVPVRIPGLFPHTDVLPRIPLPQSSSVLPSKMPIVLPGKDMSPSVAVGVALATMRLLDCFERYYSQLSSYIELFAPVNELLASFSAQSVHPQLASAISSLQQSIQTGLATSALKRRPLKLQSHRPTAIASVAPAFDDQYNLEHRHTPDSAAAHADQETAKLKNMVKKERKGALRELKKDAQFLAGVRAQEQKRKDAEYEEKMRRVHGQLGDEVGEMKKMMAVNKKLKRRR
ncbi:nucleolar complex protein 14 [Sorochytrium milnesiophthora]